MVRWPQLGQFMEDASIRPWRTKA